MTVRLRCSRELTVSRIGLVVACCVMGLGGCRDDDTGSFRITSVSPDVVQEGTPSVTITVSGRGFDPTMFPYVLVDGGSIFTQVISETELRFTLTSALTRMPGSSEIRIVRGIDTSNVVSVTIQRDTLSTPEIVSVAPSALIANRSGQSVRIVGRSFQPTTRAFFNSAQIVPIGFTSSTQLEVQIPDSLTQSPGVLRFNLTSVNAARTVTRASAVTSLEVRAPVPTLSAISVTNVPTGQTSLPIRITGDGFLPESRLLVNGDSVATTFVDGNSLDAVIGPGPLRAPGTLTLTVRNPSPGGGLSGSRQLSVVTTVPSILMISSSGAHVNGLTSMIAVTGRNFSEGAVAQVNGTALRTSVFSGSQLSAQIPSRLLGAAGQLSLTVDNGEGLAQSTPVAISVRTLPAMTITERRIIAIANQDVEVDVARGVAYVSTGQNDSLRPNSLVVLNLQTGLVVAEAPLGTTGGQLSLARDGTALFLASERQASLRVVQLPSLSLGPLVPLRTVAPISQILRIPTRGQGWVFRSGDSFNPQYFAFIDGVLGTQSAGSTWGAFPTEGDTLYSYGGSALHLSAVTTAGVQTARVIEGISARGRPLGIAGRLYDIDDLQVIDAATQQIVGQFADNADFSVTRGLFIDPALGRAYVVRSREVIVHDMNSFTRLGRITLPDDSNSAIRVQAARVQRYRSDGLLYRDSTRIYLLRSPAFAP
jgi:hypothetical protein